jgi:uncharacterized membrane protein
MTLVAVSIISAVILAVTGGLGMTGRLPRNTLIGLRTSRTLRDDDSWRISNRTAGWYALVAGAVQGWLAVWLVGTSPPERSASTTVLAAGAVSVAVLLAGWAHAALALRRIERPLRRTPEGLDITKTRLRDGP